MTIINCRYKQESIHWLLVVIFLVNYNVLAGQDFTEVKIPLSDSIELTADMYHYSQEAPTLLLLHQSVSSRGEYRTIAPKLQAQGYNCLALDMRWGKQDFWNKIPNESAKMSGAIGVIENYQNTNEYQVSKVWPLIWNAYEDMKASIAYLQSQGYQKIIAVGSSFSAMLVFKLVFDGLPIEGLVAFSPGEYHPVDDSLLAEWAQNVTIPVYLSSGKEEQKMVEEVSQQIPSTTPITVYQSEGRHGASMLITQPEDWPSLMNFLNQFLEREEDVGFEILKTSRGSKKWDDTGEKPISAWCWYPSTGATSTSRAPKSVYVSNLKPEQSAAENLASYQRIIGGLSEKEFSEKTISSFLAEKSNVHINVPKDKNKSPLIVLSGAHPIYFTELAEYLTKAHFVVISVPRTGVQKGGRLPYDSIGLEEYREDLRWVLSQLEEEEWVDMKDISFISWSFEGVPTLQVARELGARTFISLDSSLGYDYGVNLFPAQDLSTIPFPIKHYTGSATNFGKNTHMLQRTEGAEVITSFDLAHSEFTSLSSIGLSELNGESSEPYQRLIIRIQLDIENRLKK